MDILIDDLWQGNINHNKDDLLIGSDNDSENNNSNKSSINIHIWQCLELPQFKELVQVLLFILQNQGYHVTVSNNYKLNCLNLIMESAVCPWKVKDACLSRAIIINYEQLYNDAFYASEQYLEIMRLYPVWDYSKININWLKDKNIHHVSFIRLDYCPSMTLIPEIKNILESKEIHAEQLMNTESNYFSIIPPIKCKLDLDIINKDKLLVSSTPLSSSFNYITADNDDGKNIDVLFMGYLGNRRTLFIKSLQSMWPNRNIVATNTAWEDNRTDLIKRSKCIISIHQHETFIFPWPRISFLMSNGAFIISEISNDDDDYNMIHSSIIRCTLEMMPAVIDHFLNKNSYTMRKEISLRALYNVHSLKSIVPSLPKFLKSVSNTINNEDIDWHSYLAFNNDVYIHWRYKSDNNKEFQNVALVKNWHYDKFGTNEQRAYCLLSPSVSHNNYYLPSNGDYNKIRFEYFYRLMKTDFPKKYNLLITDDYDENQPYLLQIHKMNYSNIAMMRIVMMAKYAIQIEISQWKRMNAILDYFEITNVKNNVKCNDREEPFFKYKEKPAHSQNKNNTQGLINPILNVIHLFINNII